MLQFLTPQDIADILLLSYESALAFIKQSGIDYIQIGRQYRVSRDAFESFVKRKGQWIVSLDG